MTAASNIERGADDDLPGSQFALFSGFGLFGLSVLFALGVWTDRHLLTLFCALILAAALLGRFWASLSIMGLRCESSLSETKAFPGDTVQLSITLDNRKPLPLAWSKAELGVPSAVAPETAGVPWRGRVGFATALAWFESATWQCPLVCRRRGYYHLGPSKVLTGDGFGLYLNARTSSSRLSLLVYPRLYALEDLGLPSRQPLGEARDPSMLFEDASRIRGLRDYTPETPFKKIAWAASARSGRLRAKTFEPTASVQTVIFLAVDRFATGGDPALFELAISTAASLAARLIDQRQPVGLLCNGKLADGSGPVVQGAGRGEGQLDGMLESLAKLRRSTASSFDCMLDSHTASLSGGTTLCVVAEQLTGSDLDRLAMLRRRGCGVIALMVGSSPMPEGSIACRRIDAKVLQGLRA